MAELSEEQRSELRRDLDALRESLAASLAESAAAARPVELDQPAVGRVSRIDAIQQQKIVEAGRAAQRARLQQVRQALARCDEDEFGECLECGEDVGFQRLKARPESLFCVDCQTRREDARRERGS